MPEKPSARPGIGLFFCPVCMELQIHYYIEMMRFLAKRTLLLQSIQKNYLYLKHFDAWKNRDAVTGRYRSAYCSSSDTVTIYRLTAINPVIVILDRMYF